MRARYCVGADGAHSPVREALGVPFEGVTNAHTFYVADAAGVTGLVEEAINMRITAEHFLLAFPMGRRARAAARRRCAIATSTRRGSCARTTCAR